MRVNLEDRGREGSPRRPSDKGNGHRISVMLVNNDPGFRQVATAILQTHYGSQVDIVATACCGEECLALAQILAPQVLLMDVGRPRKDGLGAIPLLHILFPQIHVIALTSQDGERSRRLVSAAGARGLVVKSAVETDLIPAIESALKGKSTGAARRRAARAVSVNKRS